METAPVTSASEVLCPADTAAESDRGLEATVISYSDWPAVEYFYGNSTSHQRLRGTLSRRHCSRDSDRGLEATVISYSNWLAAEFFYLLQSSSIYDALNKALHLSKRTHSPRMRDFIILYCLHYHFPFINIKRMSKNCYDEFSISC
jgi:hypothetical protein